MEDVANQSSSNYINNDLFERSWWVAMGQEVILIYSHKYFVEAIRKGNKQHFI